MMIPSYTCLAQSSPEPAGLQKLGLDHQRTATITQNVHENQN